MYDIEQPVGSNCIVKSTLMWTLACKVIISLLSSLSERVDADLD